MKRSSLWIIGPTPDHFHFLEDRIDNAIARELDTVTKDPKNSFTSRLQIIITIDTILGIGIDHLNIYLSEALNSIGTVLFRGQWANHLTQPGWTLYHVPSHSIVLPLDLTVNPSYFLIQDVSLNHYYYYMCTSSSLQNRSEIDPINQVTTRASLMKNLNYFPLLPTPLPPPHPTPNFPKK